MVFAKLMVEVVDEMRAKGFEKPVVASLAGDVEWKKTDIVSARYPGICLLH